MATKIAQAQVDAARVQVLAMLRKDFAEQIADHEDLANDALLRGIESKRRNGPLGPYCITAARRLALRLKRRTQRELATASFSDCSTQAFVSGARSAPTLSPKSLGRLLRLVGAMTMQVETFLRSSTGDAHRTAIVLRHHIESVDCSELRRLLSFTSEMRQVQEKTLTDVEVSHGRWRIQESVRSKTVTVKTLSNADKFDATVSRLLQRPPARARGKAPRTNRPRTVKHVTADIVNRALAAAGIPATLVNRATLPARRRKSKLLGKGEVRLERAMRSDLRIVEGLELGIRALHDPAGIPPAK